MGYRVRNEHGELRFESFAELKEAWQQQLLGPEDEVLADGSTSWQKASSIPKLAQVGEERSFASAGELRWYVVAAVVATVGVALLWAVTRGWIGGVIVLICVALLSIAFFNWAMAKVYRRKRR